MRTGRTRGPAGLARRDGRGEAWADTTPRSSYRLSPCSDLTLAHAAAATCQDRVPGRHLSRSAPPAPWISRRADVECVRPPARLCRRSIGLRSLPRLGCCSQQPACSALCTARWPQLPGPSRSLARYKDDGSMARLHGKNVPKTSPGTGEASQVNWAQSRQSNNEEVSPRGSQGRSPLKLCGDPWFH